MLMMIDLVVRPLRTGCDSNWVAIEASLLLQAHSAERWDWGKAVRHTRTHLPIVAVTTALIRQIA
jgi:hypothetical protein